MVLVGGPRRHRPRLVAGRAPGLRGHDDLRRRRDPYTPAVPPVMRMRLVRRDGGQNLVVRRGGGLAAVCPRVSGIIRSRVCIVRGAVTASSVRFGGLQSMQEGSGIVGKGLCCRGHAYSPVCLKQCRLCQCRDIAVSANAQ